MNKLIKLSTLITLSVLFISGCTSPPPVGVDRATVEDTFTQINTSILNSDEMSNLSHVVLHRYNLTDIYEKDIIKAIETLHEIAEGDSRADIRISLSELCFAAGKKKRAYKTERGVLSSEGCYIASAFYAYRYIQRHINSPGSHFFKQDLRRACDLYNMGLSAAIIGNRQKIRDERVRQILPVGSISLECGHYEMPLPLNSYESFIAADRMTVRGLSTRNRSEGIGAPVIAVIKGEDKPIGNMVPATLFLRITGDLKSLRKEGVRAEIELYDTLSTQSVNLSNKRVPLETDTTTPIAYTLENPALWKLGLQMFRLGKMKYPDGIYPASTYDEHKIPVILVHGTMSSFVWWAEMLNTLSSYPEISNNYQFWLYLYDSAQPIIFSARSFIDDVDETINMFDPQNKNQKLKHMVVVGHSQGGLLTRLLAIDSGELIINELTGKSIAELGLNKKESDLIRRYTVFTPHQSVDRVVYLCTPHRGSFLASSFVRKIATWFIKLPENMVSTIGNFRKLLSNDVSLEYLQMTHTSIDGMSPDNKVLLKFAELPAGGDIKQHSIIAIKDDKKPPDGNDGVVKYTSAHLKDAESQVVIKSSHSSQQHPAAIEEVRRILLEHLKEQQSKAQ